jgi:hypothetical protein
MRVRSKVVRVGVVVEEKGGVVDVVVAEPIELRGSKSKGKRKNTILCLIHAWR